MNFFANIANNILLENKLQAGKAVDAWTPFALFADGGRWAEISLKGEKAEVLSANVLSASREAGLLVVVPLGASEAREIPVAAVVAIKEIEGPKIEATEPKPEPVATKPKQLKDVEDVELTEKQSERIKEKTLPPAAPEQKARPKWLTKEREATAKEAPESLAASAKRMQEIATRLEALTTAKKEATKAIEEEEKKLIPEQKKLAEDTFAWIEKNGGLESVYRTTELLIAADALAKKVGYVNLSKEAKDLIAKVEERAAKAIEEVELDQLKKYGGEEVQTGRVSLVKPTELKSGRRMPTFLVQAKVTDSLKKLWSGVKSWFKDVLGLEEDAEALVSLLETEAGGVTASKIKALGLREGLLDMIEGGRLTEDMIPDDFQWLTQALGTVAATAKIKGADFEQRMDEGVSEDEQLAGTGDARRVMVEMTVDFDVPEADVESWANIHKGRLSPEQHTALTDALAGEDGNINVYEVSVADKEGDFN